MGLLFNKYHVIGKNVRVDTPIHFLFSGQEYENADDIMAETRNDPENVYENPSCSTVDEEAKIKTVTRVIY